MKLCNYQHFGLRPSQWKHNLSIFKAFFVSAALFLTGIVSAQTITGTVLDTDGLGVIGANIVVQGTTIGTVTDFDGSYTLEAPAGSTAIVYSYLGYKSQTVEIAGRTVIDVTLEADTEILDEVVVVGYGTQKRSDLTGAVASIKGSEIASLVAGNPTSALQGKVTGVIIENNGGQPGGETNVFVRGVSSLTNSYPLYVVDGTIVENMNFINPKDIESLQVLKDASSAAIYGSRAANGVVLITTKRGDNDGKPRVSVDLRTGVENPSKMLDLLNASEFVQYRNQLEQNDNTGFTLNPTGADTDWQDLSLNAGSVVDLGASVSGGGENSSYYISGNYFDQEGILVGSGFSRYNLRANTDFSIGRFNISQSIGIAQSKIQENNWFGYDGPTAPILRENVPENEGGFEAPDFGLHNFGGFNNFGLASVEENERTQRNLLGNLSIEAKIVDGLTAKVNMGADYINDHQFLFRPTYFMSNAQLENFNDQNDLQDVRAERFTTLIEPTLTYEKEFDNNRLNAVIGFTEQKTDIRSVGVAGQGTPNNDIKSPSALPPSNSTLLIGDQITSGIRSLFGRVNYVHDNKYIISAIMRRDESSRFAPEFRTGYFPSVSVGWNIANEDFFQSSSINKLKIRGGYGELGSQNIPDYSYQSVFGITSPASFGGALVQGYAQTSLAIPNIKWEVAKTINIGADVGLFDDQLQFSTEYYVKDVSDVLVAVNLPSTVGFSEPVVQNVGAIRNSGFEFEGIYRKRGDFNWNLGFNIATFNSEVTSLPNLIAGPSTSEDGTTVNRYVEGLAPGVFWGFVIDTEDGKTGVYPDQASIDNDPNISNDATRRSSVSPGDFIRKDLNGDGVINVDDQTELGHPTPDFIYGMNFTGGYKNLDFGVFFQGSQGAEIYNVVKFYNTFWADDNKSTDVLRGWTPNNTNTDVPRATTVDAAENRAASSYFVEDGSYLRLRTLELGYTLDLPEVEFMDNVRFFITGQNLLTLTGYSGYDPDISSAQGGRAGNGNALLSRGIDVRAYPNSRTFMLGVQATF